MSIFYNHSNFHNFQPFQLYPFLPLSCTEAMYPSGSQFLLKGLGGACMRNRETSRIQAQGVVNSSQTGCRNSLFETVKSKAKPWQTLAGFKPQAEANSSSKGCVGHACETGKPQQDSSARGGQFVPWRAAETASSKRLKAKQTLAGFKP